MENAVDYCVNIMLTVSYDRPIFRLYIYIYIYIYIHIYIYTHTQTMTISRTHARMNARKHARGSRVHNQDSSVGTVTVLGAERSEVPFRLRNVQIGYGTHSASYTMGTGVLVLVVLGLKRLGCELTAASIWCRG